MGGSIRAIREWVDVCRRVVVRFAYKDEDGILVWKVACGVLIVILADLLYDSLHCY